MLRNDIYTINGSDFDLKSNCKDDECEQWHCLSAFSCYLHVLWHWLVTILLCLSMQDYCNWNIFLKVFLNKKRFLIKFLSLILWLILLWLFIEQVDMSEFADTIKSHCMVFWLLWFHFEVNFLSFGLLMQPVPFILQYGKFGKTNRSNRHPKETAK